MLFRSREAAWDQLKVRIFSKLRIGVFVRRFFFQEESLFRKVIGCSFVRERHWMLTKAVRFQRLNVIKVHKDMLNRPGEWRYGLIGSAHSNILRCLGDPECLESRSSKLDPMLCGNFRDPVHVRATFTMKLLGAEGEEGLEA